jgi:hypothetical protein
MLEFAQKKDTLDMVLWLINFFVLVLISCSTHVPPHGCDRAYSLVDNQFAFVQVIISSKSIQMGCDHVHILSTIYLHS